MTELVEVPIEARPIEDILREMDAQLPDSEGKFSKLWQYRQELKAKYGLPESGDRWDNPFEYIRKIEERAQEEGISIRPKHEFEAFFAEHSGAGAVAFAESEQRDRTVVVSGAREDEWYQLRARANQLSHEFVHALQDKFYPRMPHEEAEREAYFYQQFTPKDIRYHAKMDAEQVVRFVAGIERGIQDSVTINNQINPDTSSVSNIQ